jgi:hypothetical protein
VQSGTVVAAPYRSAIFGQIGLDLVAAMVRRSRRGFEPEMADDPRCDG